jgi:excisionase family DNA binding protein
MTTLMGDLLTAREVEDLVKVDRTTIYRMLKDGRLSGVKTGFQWRFSRESVERLLSGAPADQRPASRPAEVLPIHCIQPIQDVFAEVAGLSAVTVGTDGMPLTEPSNPCRFCALIQSSPSGQRACQESWRAIGDVQPGVLAICHAGLSYAHSAINAEGQTVARLIAGQFCAEGSGGVGDQVARLSAAHGLDAAALREAAEAIPTISDHTCAKLPGWLERVAGSFETLTHERAALVGKLRRIAAITVLDEVS